MSGRSQTQSASGSVRGSIKFAGEEAKDRMYEPKHKRKVVRVLTVIAYVFSVSLAAIMLSLYYIFIWQGTKPTGPSHTNFGYHGHSGECRHQVSMINIAQAFNESQMAETPRALPALEDLLTSPLPPCAKPQVTVTVSMINIAQAFNESQMAETPRALPALEDLITSPLPPSDPPADVYDAEADNNTSLLTVGVLS